MSVDAVLKPGPGSIKLPRSSSPLVKANALLFAHFERPDLKKAENYLRDFGLILLRGPRTSCSCAAPDLTLTSIA